MTERLHLKPRHRAVLEALVREHLPDVEVRAYGSRIDGRSHDGSDLGLVLPGRDRLRGRAGILQVRHAPGDRGAQPHPDAM